MTPQQRREHAKEWLEMHRANPAGTRQLWREDRDWRRGLRDGGSPGERLVARLRVGHRSAEQPK